MKHLVFLVFSLLSLTLTAQVEIDKRIELTGSGSDAKIEGIKEVVFDEDAANKKYVDDAIISLSSGSSQPDFYLGKDTLGGIVFYVYTGGDGNQHGLIISKTQLARQWHTSTGTMYGASNVWDGSLNTTSMPSGSPAKTWVTALGSGWYIPSIYELQYIWFNRAVINKLLAGNTLINSSIYWSSTECQSPIAPCDPSGSYSGNGAIYMDFVNGEINRDNKNVSYTVRGIRAF